MGTKWLTIALLVGTASADGKKIDTTPVKAKELPAGVTFRGDFISAVKFDDKNGTNYIVFGGISRAQAVKTQQNALYVEDWVVPAKGSPRNLLPVRDFVEKCEMGDNNARFHDAAFSVTDLDKNGIAEVTFAYELSCKSDVSPSTYKLLVLENGTKYILRGETTVDPGDGVIGGKFTPDPDKAKWPAAFLTHATSTWTATSKDLGVKE
ncbi:MAG: hypothetical protein QM831_22820 [Kofleriaceae bacterium]